MADDTVTLKPCPFCGGKAVLPVLDEEFDASRCGCSVCNAYLWEDTEAEAIAAWNTRLASPAPDAGLVGADIRRLIVAARNLVFSDHRPVGAPETRDEVELIDLFAQLDEATEAFAESVPWNDEPALREASQ